MFRASVSNLSSYYFLANLTLWWCGSVRSGTMSDFACWVGMGMKLSEWVGRHRSIWVGRSSTHFHNFTVACLWKLCWFGISDSMKCSIRILQRVLCDLSQISMVCFIIGMIGTMMKAAAEQTDRVLRDTSQISLNLWCSVSWSERPTGTEQITCCPANCRQTRTLKGEPSSSWRTPEKQSSDIVNFLDTNNLPKIQWRSWVPCSWRWINCLTSTVWSGIILNHIDIWYLLAIFIRKQESICRRSLLKMKDFQPLNIPVHSSTPPPPRICLHWQFLKTLNAPHKLLKAITLNLL